MQYRLGVAGIAYSYTIELRDQGPVYGFLLPAEYEKLLEYLNRVLI